MIGLGITFWLRRGDRPGATYSRHEHARASARKGKSVNNVIRTVSRIGGQIVEAGVIQRDVDWQVVNRDATEQRGTCRRNDRYGAQPMHAFTQSTS